MKSRRVLLTGPVGSLDEWAETARAQGLRALAEPLLRIRSTPFEIQRPPDWLLVTSHQALESIRTHVPALTEVPVAVVGDRSARELSELGLRIALGPYASGAELFDAWHPHLNAGQIVLWPGGPQRGPIAKLLSQAAVELDLPLAYRTEAVPGPALPEVDAILFAAPSSVEAALHRGWQGRPIGVAIGPSTREALETAAGKFAAVHQLQAPTADAFGQWCGELLQRD